MYVPPPPPPLPTQKKSSPLIPLLIVGAIGTMTVAAAIVAGIIIFMSMREPDARPPVADLPVVEAPREPEPAPAFVDPEAQKTPAEPAGPRPRQATAEVERRPARPAARPAPGEGVVGSRLGEESDDPPPLPRALRVGGNIPAPTKLRNVNPIYPAIAISARIQGVVIIEATIDPEGKVSEARVLRSVPLLDQAALDAVRQWEYTPTLLNGKPVPVIMTVTVNFTLR